jgi:hypothetical protein
VAISAISPVELLAGVALAEQGRRTRPGYLGRAVVEIKTPPGLSRRRSGCPAGRGPDLGAIITL